MIFLSDLQEVLEELNKIYMKEYFKEKSGVSDGLITIRKSDYIKNHIELIKFVINFFKK